MFIGRKADGTIYGCWTVPQWVGQEELPDNDPAVLAFEAASQAMAAPKDQSNLDNLDKTLKAVGLLMRDYCNSLKAGTYTTKTVADIKADFTVKYNSLP